MSEHTNALSPREVFERLLHTMERNAWNDCAELYAEKFINEMPFAPPGFPTRFEDTRETLYARLKGLGNLAQFEKIDVVAIHETLDPEVIVGEYQLQGKNISSGRPFTVFCIKVITVRDGQIVFLRDYTNPIANAVVVERLPDLIAALSAENPE